MMAALPLQRGAEGDRAALPSPMHAGTAEPLRVSPPEAVAYPLELEVILTLSDLFLPELTWSATPSSLYCVSWSIAFIEVGATTAIPKRLCKEMQYA